LPAFPPSCALGPLDPGGAALAGCPLPGVRGLPGTAQTRAGPRAAGLSRRCTGRPEMFFVPRGPARCSRVRACGPWAHGPRRLPLPGGWGTGPQRLRPCGRPTFVDRSLVVGRWGRRETLIVCWPRRVSRPDAGRAVYPAPLPGWRRASRVGRSPRRGPLSCC